MTQFTDLITFAGTVTAHAILKSENSLVPFGITPSLAFCMQFNLLRKSGF